MDEATRMILGLILGVGIMIFLVMCTKIHTFIALLIAAMITGIIGGMPITDITNADGKKVTGLITAIQSGFGSTLSSTGIIIGLGVMMGGILEKSGGAERLAFTFIKFIGKKKEEWALGITGLIVSIPVFADSALLIFTPLLKGMSQVTGKSVVGLALSLAAGLQLSHSLIPPTPGPLTAAGLLNVDMGSMIFTGIIVSIIPLIAAIFYTKWLGTKIYQIPNEQGGFDRKEFKAEYIRSMSELEKLMGAKQMPSFMMSLAPIVVPLILIFAKTILDVSNAELGAFNSVVDFLGSPIAALMIGTLIAIYGLAFKDSKKDVLKVLEDSVKSTGMIMLITGACGCLGNVIKVSGLGNVLGDAVVNLPIPALLIPFVIAALMRIALGSATVAITTAATLTAPLMSSLGASPILLAQACCAGAISFSYFNDSGFWVFNGMFGISELKDQVMCKFAVSMIMSILALIVLFIMQIFVK
ncbi:gluconate:H+ symporter [uncultured Brachyspira sp.]|uniref:GntP family permease n=1 Tax=uncultured Brachyspira sp. TaxID=221953 RepID=UPI002638D951|nr:gluconate:H+ symporter [uncultured Brachyspira sp.]